MGMRILGVQKAINRFDKFEGELETAVQETAEESAINLYQKSQFFVPKKTGALAASGRFVIHSNVGAHARWGVKYGYQVPDSSDESVLDYAAAVHEILKASHKSPTRAKFVETPLFQSLINYRKFGGEECRKAVKRSFR